MRTLLFMRHAWSVVTQPGQTDSERSLTTRGRLEAPMVARALRQRGVHPEFIVSSPAVRALTTARLVAEELQLAHDAILLEPALYEASAEHYLDIVNGLPDVMRSVLLVGHNPGLTEFVNVLAPGAVGEMPPSGIAVIGIDRDRWSQVRAGCGTLLLVERPTKDRP